MSAVWRIEMLGTLKAVREEGEITRFRTRRVALLLAYLAFYPNREPTRDEVGEMLWPEGDPEAMRRNLRQALSSLRHVLEPPPIPSGAILLSPSSRLGLKSGYVTTDVAEFEGAVETARQSGPPGERFAALKRAVALYKGELLPGFDEDWVLRERLRLEDLFLYALRRLIEHSGQFSDPEETIDYLRLALTSDPFNEEWHVLLMQAYLEAERPESAVTQYAELEGQLRIHLQSEPGRRAQELVARARREGRKERTIRPTEIPSPVVARTPVDEPRPQRTVRLPMQLTRFYGRQAEIDLTLGHLLDRETRLVTLLGPAGTGKTRLAVEVGRRVAARGDWNVWFVPLADLADASMIMDAVLDTLRARRSDAKDPFEALGDALVPNENHLLILDNLEHLVDAAAPIVGEIVARVPQLRVVATSRQVLRLSAEHRVTLAPLPTPAPSPGTGVVDRTELDHLAESPSIQVFVDRCQAIRPDFQITPHNARAIASICGRLEGIPLAIELAAGLSGSFAPAQMLTYLHERLTGLTSRRRDLPARHQSLRAAIDYSYDSLSPEMQRFFAALSPFRGGFTVEAATFVAADASGPRAEEASLDAIFELQERSLLQAVAADEEGDLRFRMLESFREYGEAHLSEEEHQAVRVRHARYYRSHPAPSAVHLTAEERTRRHRWIEAEFDNYVAALDFCLGEGEIEACIELLETLAATWTSRGPRTIERTTIRQVAARSAVTPIAPVARISILRMLGTTLIRSAEYAAAYRACGEALEVAERNGLPDQIAVCLSALGTCAGYLGNLDECLALNLRVLACATEENLRLFERAYLAIGAVHWGRGEFAPAEVAWRRAEEVSTEYRGGEPDTHVLYNLAWICMNNGDFDEAMARLGEGMRIAGRVRDDFGLAMGLSLVSRYHWLKGNLAGAVAAGREALLKYRESDFSHWSLLGLHQHALVLTDKGEWAAAATLLAASRGIGREARLPDEWDHARALATIRGHLSPAAFEGAWAQGLAMDTGEAFRLALSFA